MVDIPKASDVESMNIKEYEEFKHTMLVLQRIAIIALHRLGQHTGSSTMRITDPEWAAAEGADLQWRTIRMPSLAPEIHVACTLVSEQISGQALHSMTGAVLGALRTDHKKHREKQ